jgi:hypothetical protein
VNEIPPCAGFRFLFSTLPTLLQIRRNTSCGKSCAPNSIRADISFFNHAHQIPRCYASEFMEAGSGIPNAATFQMASGRDLKGETMLRILKRTTCLVAATILLGGICFAQRSYSDDGYYRPGGDPRYDRDYRDRRYDDWKYENRPWANNGRDGYYRGSYDYRGGGNRGFSFGFQDGAYVAREDMALGKPYHPDPRGKYKDADRGYDRYLGDKHEYRAQYAEGYRRGYVRAFRSRY